MALKHNPWPKQLLSWHGHRGGVRVPFQGDPSPLEDDIGLPTVIETRLIRKLRKLAHDLVMGAPVPRLIFLVGGPGNGKSEAVQDFLKELDEQLQAHGRLVDILRTEFEPTPLLQWCVDIGQSAVRHVPHFADKIGRLIVIQDASASEEANQNAAEVLATYIEDLITHPHPLPVFVCCVNRGLLTRCLRSAHDDGKPPEVIQLLRAIIQASALGKDALKDQRIECWPLSLPGQDLDQLIACWPLDMESLLLPPADLGLDASPLEQAIRQAVRIDRWQDGDCKDCEASESCPFLQNAQWLQNEHTLANLGIILRRSELSTGQRWNFRDAFSLVAELMVGETQDFAPETHPCSWVHLQVTCLQSEDHDALESCYRLLSRLYPNALFPVPLASALPDRVQEISETAAALESSLPYKGRWSPTHIRSLLRDRISPRLDPALWSPADPESPLAQLEFGYSQSVVGGNVVWPLETAPMSTVERPFFYLLSKADDLDSLGRDFARVSQVKAFLRAIASTHAKRSVGVRLGLHAELEFLSDYESSIRDDEKLFSLTKALRSLLGDGNRFVFNPMGSFGQPQDGEAPVLLQAPPPILRIIPAPRVHEDLPAHDFPHILVEDHSIPLTFDLYLALRLRREGFSNSSLPSSVRAAIDHIRHLLAGKQCRDKTLFQNQSAEFVVANHGSVVILPYGEQNPLFSPKGE